jgi:hypothetical protein
LESGRRVEGREERKQKRKKGEGFIVSRELAGKQKKAKGGKKVAGKDGWTAF